MRSAPSASDDQISIVSATPIAAELLDRGDAVASHRVGIGEVSMTRDTDPHCRQGGDDSRPPSLGRSNVVSPQQ